MCQKYNGWPNYPTWYIASFLNEHAQDITRKLALKGADVLKKKCEALLLEDDADRAGLDLLQWAETDLIQWALNQVDWAYLRDTLLQPA